MSVAGWLIFFAAEVQALTPLVETKMRLIRETDALPAKQELAGFHVPEGFKIQLFASEPMIEKPINMAFDDQGRLWVSSTSEYPYAASPERWADPQGSRVQDSRDAIKILVDTDGDGTADTVLDFADGLNIPTGVLPWHKPEHKAGCIAWSIPNIWYFADTTGSGKADHREILFGPLGYEKDTHGMCSSFRLGADGWVYATHGFNNTSHLKAKDGSSVDLHSGNVFRFRPDGSRVELVAAGQVNPFGLCWDKRGNLYSTDCHSNPLTQILRGAFYPSFGKPADGLGFGPVMCEHSHGSTGLCGVVYIDGGIWGPEWDDHMILGNCVTSKVNHDLIHFTGTTPKAEEKPDFITSDDPWFRPVDLQLGPDNALYIADFYNKIIGHYELPLDHPGRDRTRGRIWRVVKSGASRLVAKPVVRVRTIEELASADPFVRRAAAAWISERPSVEALQPLFEALTNENPEDLQLVHQLRIALRDVLKIDGAFARPELSENAALLLGIAPAVPTADAARYVVDHWKESATPASVRLEHVARYGDSAALAGIVTVVRGETEADPTLQLASISSLRNGLLERGLKLPPAVLDWTVCLAQQLLVDFSTQPADWISNPHPEQPTGDTPWCLDSRKTADGAEVQVLSSLDRTRKSPERLTGVLRSRVFAAPKRLAFWVCGHRGTPEGAAHDKNVVRLWAGGKVIRQAFPPRKDVLQRVEWDLAEHAGEPVELELVDGEAGNSYAWLAAGGFDPAVLEVAGFGATEKRAKNLKVLAGFLRGEGPVNLRDRLAVYLPSSTGMPTPAKPRPELDALIKDRVATFAKAPGDPAQGALVFETQCAVCHQIKGAGSLVGPQLDGVGSRGAERLIEDVLDPDRNVDTHFRLHVLTLRDGAMSVGFVRGEVGQLKILVDAAGNELRLAKGDIVEDKELPQSPMPSVFGQSIDPASFQNLIAWLLKN